MATYCHSHVLALGRDELFPTPSRTLSNLEKWSRASGTRVEPVVMGRSHESADGESQLVKWPRWTGIGERSYEQPDGTVVQPSKTGWDLLQLLIVPAILVGAGLLYNGAQTAQQNRLATQTAQDATLNAYFLQMSGLMLHNKLLTSHHGPAPAVASAITGAAISRLNTARQIEVASFLSDAGLSGAHLRGASLRGAYMPDAHLLGANLRGADLSGAYLRGAHFTDANFVIAELIGTNLGGAHLGRATLRGAHLTGANLAGADFRKTHLFEANLRGANLSGTDLRGAHLNYADLRGANLSGANLSGANLSGADLTGAKFKRTTCPDGKITNSNC